MNNKNGYEIIEKTVKNDDGDKTKKKNSIELTSKIVYLMRERTKEKRENNMDTKKNETKERINNAFLLVFFLLIKIETWYYQNCNIVASLEDYATLVSSVVD